MFKRRDIWLALRTTINNASGLATLITAFGSLTAQPWYLMLSGKALYLRRPCPFSTTKQKLKSSTGRKSRTRSAGKTVSLVSRFAMLAQLAETRIVTKENASITFSPLKSLHKPSLTASEPQSPRHLHHLLPPTAVALQLIRHPKRNPPHRHSNFTFPIFPTFTYPSAGKLPPLSQTAVTIHLVHRDLNPCNVNRTRPKLNKMCQISHQTFLFSPSFQASFGNVRLCDVSLPITLYASLRLSTESRPRKPPCEDAAHQSTASTAIEMLTQRHIRTISKCVSLPTFVPRWHPFTINLRAR